MEKKKTKLTLSRRKQPVTDFGISKSLEKICNYDRKSQKPHTKGIIPRIWCQETLFRF